MVPVVRGNLHVWSQKIFFNSDHPRDLNLLPAQSLKLYFVAYLVLTKHKKTVLPLSILFSDFVNQKNILQKAHVGPTDPIIVLVWSTAPPLLRPLHYPPSSAAPNYCSSMESSHLPLPLSESSQSPSYHFTSDINFNLTTSPPSTPSLSSPSIEKKG